MPEPDPIFRRQPIPIVPGSDSEAMSSDGHEQPRPISLLSSMLSDRSSPYRKRNTSGYTSGPSASSTAPSTAFSSPRPHGEEPISILRRVSIGSDSEPFHLPASQVAHVVPKESEFPKKPRALKFAVANHPTEEGRRSSVPPNGSSGDDDDDGDRSIHTDQGYEEDSEDGFSSDEEPLFWAASNTMKQFHARQAQLAAARSRSKSPHLSPSSRPPIREGDGHVRVDPSAAEDSNRCSRHNSPPPDGRPLRSAPPGPRDGRAGSPAPTAMDIVEDDNECDDEADGDEAEDDADELQGTDGDCTISSVPVPPTVGDHSESMTKHTPSAGSDPTAAGKLRDILRRASEHLPSIRRPSFTTPISDDSAVAFDEDDNTPCPSTNRVLISRARSLGSRPAPSAANQLESAEPPAVRSRPVACPSRA